MTLFVHLFIRSVIQKVTVVLFSVVSLSENDVGMMLAYIQDNRLI